MGIPLNSNVPEGRSVEPTGGANAATDYARYRRKVVP